MVEGVPVGLAEREFEQSGRFHESVLVFETEVRSQTVHFARVVNMLLDNAHRSAFCEISLEL